MDHANQRGAGLWGTIFVLAVLGFIALVTVKLLPIYLNQMKVAAAVKEVAANGGLHGEDDAYAIHEGLQRHWDIDDIGTLQPRDVQVVRDSNGLQLSYSYDARTRLFYNIFVVIHFQGEVPVTGGHQSY